MNLTAYLDIAGDGGKGYFFEPETGRIIQETDFACDNGRPLDIELPEGVQECLISVPLGWLGIRVLEIAMDDRERIREVLPFEMEGLILGDPQEMVIDSVMLEKGLDQKSSVLAAYIEKNRLAPILESLKSAGLDPRTVTSSELGELVHGIKAGRILSEILQEGIKPEASQLLERARQEMAEPTVNFRTGQFAYTKETERTMRMMIKTAALAAALLIALSGHMVLKAAMFNNEAAALESRSLEIYAELFPGDPAKNAKGLMYKAEANVKAIKDKSELYREAGALDLLMELQKIKWAGIKVTEITVDDKALELRGTAPSLEEINSLKEELAKSLNETTISESGAAASGGVSFIITARKVRQ